MAIDPREQIIMKYDSKYIFVEENEFKFVVYKEVIILSRPQYYNDKTDSGTDIELIYSRHTTCHASRWYRYFDGLVQDCSIPIANAEILQSCAKPSISPLPQELCDLYIYIYIYAYAYAYTYTCTCTSTYTYTVRCRYSAVGFLTNIHKIHPIARPLGRAMGCLLWFQHLIDILLQFL